MLFGKSEPKLIMFKALLSRCKQINILVFSHHNLGVHSCQSRVRKEASDMTSGQQFIIIHQVAIVLLQSESPDDHTGIIQHLPF